MDRYAGDKVRKHLIETYDKMSEKFENDPRLKTLPTDIPRSKSRLEQNHSFQNTIGMRLCYGITLKHTDSEITQSTIDDVIQRLDLRRHDLLDDYSKNFDDSIDKVFEFLNHEIELPEWKEYLLTFSSNADLNAQV